ncbi:MAG TPA: endonuclease/exonuclease/phosphatase family protein [Actinomycetota bacterium]|nr:endonuclease/exonuclease/phosphatase family protein [Actinomycetota bacterium]
MRTSAARVRVVAYNVRGFRAGARRVAEAVGGLDADVLLLQETGGRLALRRFARALGMAVAADPPSPFRRRVKDAVLARPPWRLGRHRLHRFPGSAPWYPRGALVARLLGPGAAVWAVSFHLGLRPGERRRHAALLRALLAGLGGPVVAGGDLNEGPEGRAASLLRGTLVDAWEAAGSGPGPTFPARAPSARIDHVYVSRDVRVDRCVVARDGSLAEASDHLPVVADLWVPARPEREGPETKGAAPR